MKRLEKKCVFEDLEESISTDKELLNQQRTELVGKSLGFVNLIEFKKKNDEEKLDVDDDEWDRRKRCGLKSMKTQNNSYVFRWRRKKTETVRLIVEHWKWSFVLERIEEKRPEGERRDNDVHMNWASSERERGEENEKERSREKREERRKKKKNKKKLSSHDRKYWGWRHFWCAG